jgi:hypothetical protein
MQKQQINSNCFLLALIRVIKDLISPIIFIRQEKVLQELVVLLHSTNCTFIISSSLYEYLLDHLFSQKGKIALHVISERMND